MIPNSVQPDCLDIFEEISILNSITRGDEQKIYPINSLNESSIDFSFVTDRNVFTDLRKVDMYLKVKLVKDGRPVTAEDDVCLVNNSMHSLFSNCEVTFNTDQVYTTNGLYAHKAFMSNEFSGTQGTKESISCCQGYSYEQSPGDFEHEPAIVKRKKDNLEEMEFYGELPIEIFNCKGLLLPNVTVHIKLIRSRPQFYLMSSKSENIHAVITNTYLKIRTLTVDEGSFQIIRKKLVETPARFNALELKPRTFIIPAGQNQFIHENIFNNAPIRTLAIAMNTNSAFTGDKSGNPFHYQKFGLREIKISRGNQVVVHMDTSRNCVPYITTMRALKFYQDGPNIIINDYENHFCLVFDLTSTQQSELMIHYPDVISASLRLELYFRENLTNTIEVIVAGEQLSSIFIDKNGKVTKNG